MEEAQSRNAVLQARDTELHIQNTRFDAALNNMSQALCMADADQRLIVCNARFLELFGLSPEDVRPGTGIAGVFDAIVAIGRFDAALVEDIRQTQRSLVLSHTLGGFLRETEDGPALAVTHQPMADGGWVATYEDVTERQRAAARIRYIAHHDALTGLPNRLLFHARMESMLRGRTGLERVVILCLDLDYFKDINAEDGGGPVAAQRPWRRCRRPPWRGRVRHPAMFVRPGRAVRGTRVPPGRGAERAL